MLRCCQAELLCSPQCSLNQQAACCCLLLRSPELCHYTAVSHSAGPPDCLALTSASQLRHRLHSTSAPGPCAIAPSPAAVPQGGALHGLRLQLGRQHLVQLQLLWFLPAARRSCELPSHNAVASYSVAICAQYTVSVLLCCCTWTLNSTRTAVTDHLYLASFLYCIVCNPHG
jgi:hypothetical protein